jgi:hypothetical protein
MLATMQLRIFYFLYNQVTVYAKQKYIFITWCIIIWCKMECYNSEYFIFCLLSKNVKIKIYTTIISSVVLCVCETWVSHIKGRTQIKGVWE